MDRSAHRPVSPPVRRWLTAATRPLCLLPALCLGLSACMAGVEDFDNYPDPIYADVYLHNSTSYELSIRVHRLAPGAALDCQRVAPDPTVLALESSFTVISEQVLEPSATLEVRDMDETRPCHAALVEVEGYSPAVLFWFEDQVPEGFVDGRIEGSEEHRSGAVLVTASGGELESVGVEVVFPVSV